MPTYNIDTNVSGNGAIDFERSSYDPNSVTFNVIPDQHYHFDHYVVYGIRLDDFLAITGNNDFIVDQDENNIVLRTYTDIDIAETPLTLYLRHDVIVTAVFVEDDKLHIYASANVNGPSIYVSLNDQYEEYTSVLFARPFPDYVFVSWEDGNIENPRTITVTSNIAMVAVYHRVTDTNGIYQYRCYVKDQLNLTAAPKAFLKVDSFDIKEDLLTNATSQITVLEMAGNVNNGDIVVLYDPTGTTLYQGVITSVEDLTLRTSQLQAFLKGDWIYNVHPSTYLEEEIAYLVEQYTQGKIYGSSYTDELVATRLGGFTVQYEGSTQAHLPTDTDDNDQEKYTIKNMEQFIYSLYEDYGIMFDFEVNFTGPNYINIKVPTYSSLKVGNNLYAIQNMSPITKIEETNRLIVFAKDKTYRTTYVATSDGIVEEPATMLNRFNITNTKIVFSDDELADLVAANLPTQMYNHKLTFTLFVKNYLYEYGDFKLGMPLDVWYYSDYFNTVLTGYQIKKTSNQNITSVDFTCGLVRQALTQMLLMGKVVR